MYICQICKEQLFNTPYHNTPAGKVCEVCYDAKAALGLKRLKAKRTNDAMVLESFEDRMDAKNAGKRRSEGSFPAFNYERQIWLLNGVEVPAKNDWDFPCHHCQSPAAIEGFNSHYEAYRCLVCNYITKVN